MGRCIRPERYFGAVEQLHGLRTADCLGSSRADCVPALQSIEEQFLGIRCAGARSNRIVLVVSVNHAEQVVGRVLFMCEDENADAFAERRSVVETASQVCADALLAPFEDKSADLARSLALGLQAAMEVTLRMVQFQGGDLAILGPDLQALAGVVTEIVT